MFRKLTLALVMILVLAALAVPALAADRVISISESSINESFRVTNPVRRTISNVVVDLQSGQAVVTATVTWRNGSANVSGTIVPSVNSNGRITWTVTTAAVNGQTVSSDILTQINNSISSSWARYWRNNGPAGRVVAVEITSDAINITVRTR